MKFIKKKAAMFGLDARIALAIFGALSVISGAALYSAIQQAKATAAVVELEELAKAYQAYVLDTGSDIDYFSGSNLNVSTVDLIKSSVAGWNGPYTSIFSEDDIFAVGSSRYVNDKYEGIILLRLTDEITFGSYTDSNSTQKTCVGNNLACFNWVSFYNVKNIEFAKKIDVMIDGTEGANSGKLRVRLHSTNKYAVYYQIMPILTR
jgi:type II secretory pathway pseudopilin PulG